MGDKKPSQLLGEMPALSVGQINDNNTIMTIILQIIWLQRLPIQTQQILSSIEELNIEKLAAAADKILEVNQPIDMFPISSQASSQAFGNDCSSALRSSIDALSKRFDNFLMESRGRSNSRNRDNSNQNRNRSTSRSEKQVNKFPECWYHFKFGSKAQKYIKPCKFDPSKKTKN